jgi:hypothetical protein
LVGCLFPRHRRVQLFLSSSPSASSVTPLPFYDQILTSFVPRRDGLHCEFAKELCESEKKTNSAPAIEFASQGKRRSSMPRLPCSQPGIKQDSPSLPASKQHHTSFRNTHRARSKALERVRQGNRRSVRGRIRFLCLVSQGGRRQLLALRSLTVALSISLFLVSLKKKPSPRASAASPTTPGSGTPSGGRAGR